MVPVPSVSCSFDRTAWTWTGPLGRQAVRGLIDNPVRAVRSGLRECVSRFATSNRRPLVARAGHARGLVSGRSLVAVHDATFLLGPAFCAAIGNGLILGYLMLRSGLVPRRFAQFGIAGGSLALVTALLVLFGAYHQTSGPSFVLTLPEAAWELSLGIYLIVKGFTPSHALYDDGRHTGVDGPLAPLLGAPERPAAP
jgi:hypothetical protein